MGALRPQLDAITDEMLEELPNRERFGDMHLGKAVEHVQIIRRLGLAFDDEDEREVPAPLIEDAKEKLGDVHTLISQLRDLDMNAPEFAAVRTQRLEHLQRIREWFIANVRPQIRGRVIELQSAQGDVEKLLVDMRAADLEAQQSLAAIREAAGARGSLQLSAYYSGQVNGHTATSRNFLWATAAATIVLAVAATVMFNSLEVDRSLETGQQWVDLARGSLVRLFFLGLGGWVVGFLVRGYRTNKHLQVVNEQRRNALDTYNLFIAATESTEAQDVVTVELLRAVFTSADTGFLPDGQDQSAPTDATAGLIGLLLAKQSK